MSDYFVINIQGLAKEDEDLATGYWFECGAEGVAETLSFRQDQDDYEPILVEKDHIDIQVYFLQPPPVERVESFALQFSVQKIDVTNEMNKDWLEEWKKGFQAFALVKDIWVVPSWLEKPKEATTVIEMDPGMAFGTGTHSTTQLSAQAIEKVVSMQSVSCALDVGTGTGILAIVSSMLGVPSIDANDIDPNACEVAQENFAKNNITNVNFVSEDLSTVQGSYDLVVANIIDGILTQLKPHLLRTLNPEGHLVVSGILKERESIFFENWGSEIKIIERFQKDEWLAFILKTI